VTSESWNRKGILVPSPPIKAPTGD